MHQALCLGSNPQTAIAIAKYPIGLELRINGKWIRLGFSVSESLDSAMPSDQKRAVRVFTYCLYTIRIAGQRVESFWTWLPSPQPILYSHPEIVFAVLIQTGHSTTQRAVLSVAVDRAIVNCAQFPSGNPDATDPYRSFMILKELENVLSR